MRATLWIAVSGLLVSGSAYAGTGRPYDGAARADDTDQASSQRPVDLAITGQSPPSSAYDLSKMKPEEARPQEKAAAKPIPVTVDPDHPGGLFPWGG